MSEKLSRTPAQFARQMTGIVVPGEGTVSYHLEDIVALAHGYLALERKLDEALAEPTEGELRGISPHAKMALDRFIKLRRERLLP